MEAYDYFACALDEEEQESIKLGAIGEFQYAPSIYTVHENETSNECNRQQISSTPPQIESKLNLLSCTITSFYHGQITKEEATFRLRNSPVGSFLFHNFHHNLRLVLLGRNAGSLLFHLFNVTLLS